MEILRVENICKTYEMDNAPVHALSDVSFSVDKGEFVAIIGASGSGKSTLLHIFCLLYTSPSPRDKRQSRMPSSA